MARVNLAVLIFLLGLQVALGCSFTPCELTIHLASTSNANENLGDLMAHLVMRDSSEYQVSVKTEGIRSSPLSKLTSIFFIPQYYRMIKGVKLMTKSTDLTESNSSSGVTVDKVVIENQHDMFTMALCPTSQPAQLINDVWTEFSVRC